MCGNYNLNTGQAHAGTPLIKQLEDKLPNRLLLVTARAV